MLQEVNFDVEICNDCNRLMGKDVKSLVFLYILHAEIYLLIEMHSFDYKTQENKE